jgi:hypothetical protein
MPKQTQKGKGTQTDKRVNKYLLLTIFLPISEIFFYKFPAEVPQND